MDIDTAQQTRDEHRVCEPPILYFGTPVVLVSTRNLDGSASLAPMSSVWWLGWRCVLGFDASSNTVANLRRTGECVVNIPDQTMAAAVDGIARTTGSNPLPAHKQRRGYRYEPDKFAAAGLTTQPSDTVSAPRARECPVQLEAVVEEIHPLGRAHPDIDGRQIVVETRVQRVHLHPDITVDGEPDRVDPDRWRPLICSFQRLYGLAPGEVTPSSLAEIPERLYRSPDVDRGRIVA